MRSDDRSLRTGLPLPEQRNERLCRWRIIFVGRIGSLANLVLAFLLLSAKPPARCARPSALLSQLAKRRLQGHPSTAQLEIEQAARTRRSRDNRRGDEGAALSFRKDIANRLFRSISRHRADVRQPTLMTKIVQNRAVKRKKEELNSSLKTLDGGPSGTRTPDLGIKSPLLYQLS